MTAQVVHRTPPSTHYRHVKTGGIYRIVGYAYIEADKTPTVIYEGAMGIWWVRPEAEFFDGRFVPCEPPAAGSGQSEEGGA